MAWVNLNTIYATKSEVNSKVPNTRTINGKALSSNVTLGASDIKLSDDTTLQSAWDSISPTEIIVTKKNISYGTLKAKKFGKLIVIYMCGVGVSSTINAWKGLQIGTISESYAPSENIYGAIATDSNVSAIKVTANGSIEVNSKSSTIYSGHNIEGQVAYLLD
jgi:hypothetical protein